MCSRSLPVAEGVTHGIPGPGRCTCVPGGHPCSLVPRPAGEGRDVPALTWHWLLPATPSRSRNHLGWKSLQNHRVQPLGWRPKASGALHGLTPQPCWQMGPPAGTIIPGLCHPSGQGPSSPEHGLGSPCRALQRAHGQNGDFLQPFLRHMTFSRPAGGRREVSCSRRGEGACPQTKEPLSRSGGQEGRGARAGAAALMWQRAGPGLSRGMCPRDEPALPRVPRGAPAAAGPGRDVAASEVSPAAPSPQNQPAARPARPAGSSQPRRWRR